MEMRLSLVMDRFRFDILFQSKNYLGFFLSLRGSYSSLNASYLIQAKEQKTKSIGSIDNGPALGRIGDRLAIDWSRD